MPKDVLTLKKKKTKKKKKKKKNDNNNNNNNNNDNNTGKLGYDRLNGTRKIGPSYAKSIVYI